MNLNIEHIDVLLLIAAVVAMLTRKMGVPYSVGLVTTGLVLALVPTGQDIHLTKELIFTVLLPPLIFEAAFFLPWKELRKDFVVVTTLATLGVALSAGITTLGMHYLANWQWSGALIFGVLIAATDPVSVIATFKEAGVHGRLRILVEAESLFNDGAAAVMFVIAIAFAAGQEISAVNASMTLLSTVGGGIICGALVAWVMLKLAGRTTDHLVEITFTVVGAYGSFLLAEHLHFSGVLATLTAGIMLGNLGVLGAISPKGREAVGAFWEYVAFVANSLIFLLIGIHEAQQDFPRIWTIALLAILLVTLGRAVAIYPVCTLFSKSTVRVSWKHQHVLFWGGLRGALALALALGLPESISGREEIITIAFAVVAFSIFVQGMTMTPLLRHMGEILHDKHDA
ncbi:MAG: sodium:proton antiporter [Gallionellaceae bacterium]|nr:sodium:proton antiporter [Gallionellaceae bacterium]